tara:strand:- start:362 stop:466 length:105 start_codon:yes stop_codon:yes gene_type:complete
VKQQENLVCAQKALMIGLKITTTAAILIAATSVI